MTHTIDDMIMNGEKSGFSRMMFDDKGHYWTELSKLLVDK